MKISPKWPYIPDHPYRLLVVGDSGSGKTMRYLIDYVTSQILIKYIYIQKIRRKQNVDI